jgi:NAD(P)-dependent dehydrogenase (short-subunit alcohol dehydrogenase family)
MTEVHSPDRLFDISGQVAIVTGGSGVLGTAMARGLAERGARVAVLARRADGVQRTVAEITHAGGEGLALVGDVLDERSLREAAAAVLETWGRIDILINAAGGTTPASTVSPDGRFFDVSPEAIRQVVDLNLTGTILPCQVFGAPMAERGAGSIVTISSMSAERPLTRVVGYAAAKAAVDNFTRWLAVDLARRYGRGLRVNAIAPGFLLGIQNRRLLVADDGSLTPRGRSVIDHTPAGTFGDPADLIGTLVWLCSPAASFVTGVVVPVDGGFSAWWGV